MVEALVVAQNQPMLEEPQRTVVSEFVSTPIPQYTMPPNRPWGMPYNFIPDGYIPPISEVPRVTMDMHPPECYKPPEFEVPRATTMGFTQQNPEIPRSAAIIASPQPIVHTFP